jgi:hypothetical protein
MVDKEVLAAMTERIVSKQEAAARQIDVAIRLYEQAEYESAITLAGAAEAMLSAHTPHALFDRLKQGRPDEFKTESEWATVLNETRNWLKHTNDPNAFMRIRQFDVWVMVCRAYTKYYEAFGEETDEMLAFTERARARGLTKK